MEIEGCPFSKGKPSKVGQLVSCELGRHDEACVLGQIQNTMFWFTLRAKESGRRAQPRTDRAQHRHAGGQDTKPAPRNKCNLLTLLATEFRGREQERQRRQEKTIKAPKRGAVVLVFT